MSKLANKRKEHNITQQQLADMSGISVRSIRAYEQGSKSINKAQVETVLALAKTLNCEIEDLMETN